MIRRRYGPPLEALGKFAYTLGQRQAAKEAASKYMEHAMRMAYEKRRQENALKMAQFHADLEMQGEMRARQWELDKMQFNSMADVQLENERHRNRVLLEDAKNMQKRQEQEAMRKQVIDMLVNKEITDTEAQRTLRNIDAKFLGYTGVLPRVEKGLSTAELQRGARFLEQYEEEKPKWYKPWKAGPIPEETQLAEIYKSLFQTGAGIPTAGTATGAAALPQPRTEAEYNAIPVGTKYIHPSLGVRIKR